MSTCQHRNTTFSRDICPDPCGVMHTYCDDCNGMVDRCAHGYVDAPANWSREQAQAAQAGTADRICDCGHDFERHGSEAGGCVECRCAFLLVTPAERAAADELTALTEEMGLYDEPDSADLDKARFAIWPEAVTGDPDGRFWQNALDGDTEAVKRVPLALAAQRAAIHARYEAVAGRIAQAAANPGLPESNARLLNVAAAEIRKVTAQ